MLQAGFLFDILIILWNYKGKQLLYSYLNWRSWFYKKENKTEGGKGMRLLFWGIILLIFGSVFSVLIFFFPVTFLKTDSLLLSIVKLSSIIISFILGITLVIIGVGNEKSKAQRELIADIESEGLLVSFAIFEKVNKS